MENSLEYLHDGIFYYSKWNGDYPYNNVTAVDGTISAGGGMGAAATGVPGPGGMVNVDPETMVADPPHGREVSTWQDVAVFFLKRLYETH